MTATGITEADWLAAADPDVLFEAVRADPPPLRALQLFALECCRRVVPNMSDPRARRGVDVIEWHLEGVCSAGQLAAAMRAVDAVSAEHGQRIWPGRPAASANPAGAVFNTAMAVSILGAHLPHLPPFTALTVSQLAARALHADYRRSPERAPQARLFRDIAGNPFRPAPHPAWRTAAVEGIARHVYAGRLFHDLPVLADALEDAGCDDPHTLAHCRGGGLHARGCWVVDWALGARAD